MRKLISLGLLALILSTFSSQVLASNAADCDGLKKADKGLHGLCVAWHNANEKNKGKIAEKFFARAGFKVPGSETPEPDPEPKPELDFYCPCWTHLTFDDICALGAPGQFSIQRDLDGNVTAGSAFFADLTDAPNVLLLSFGTAEDGCGYQVQTLSGDVVDDTSGRIQANEALDCRAEIEEIAVLHADPICAP